MFKKNIIAKNFSKSAVKYQENAIIQKQSSQFLVNLLEHNLKNKIKVLDIGSGSGFIADEIKKFNDSVEIFELDLSYEMLNLKRSFSSVKIQGDFENLPFKHESFDIVTSSFSLHWSDKFEQIFSQVFSILKTGGIFAFSMPIYDSLLELKQANIFHFNDFPKKEEVSLAVKKVNFIEEKSTTMLIQQEFDSGYDAIKSIKKIGGQYRNMDKIANKSFTKNDLLNFNNFCLKNSKQGKNFCISWRILYFLLKKNAS